MHNIWKMEWKRARVCVWVCECVSVLAYRGAGLEKKPEDQSGYQYGNEIRDKPSNG